MATDFRVESLSGDASFRRYHRIYLPMRGEVGGHEMTYLLMDAPPDKESIQDFIHVAGIMSETVNVPDIMACDEAMGFFAFTGFWYGGVCPCHCQRH